MTSRPPCWRPQQWNGGDVGVLNQSRVEVEPFSFVRAIFVWPWNENARTKQTKQTNGTRTVWLVYRTDTNARGFWLVKRTLGWKKFIMPENFLEINRYFALTSYCNTTSQSNNAFSILGFSLAGKGRGYVLITHWLKKQITKTYRNHFSRSYENRSINESASKLYLTQVHDNTLVYFLPQVSSENLNEWDLQCWNLAVHEDSGEIKLNLESNVNLQEMKQR